MNQCKRHIGVLPLLLLTLVNSYVMAQCPAQQWDLANIGSAYVESLGQKSVFGDFTNLRDAQYVNDGRLYFFGNISNEGHIGDGFGYEYIKTCDTSTTLIEGLGSTEFNILDINNPADVVLKKDIRIKTNLHFNSGIVQTDRNIFRERVFFIEGATHSGAADDKHIDGTIARQGQGSFIFPLGDGDHQSRLAVRGENPFDIFVATYHSSLQNASQFYAKGEFLPDSTDYNVASVQPKEFWTLSGGQTTKVTLYWTDFSDIENLSDDVNNLIIVGWDGEKWVNLGNTDLQELSDTDGYITSTNVVPNRYDAFTFGVMDTDGDSLADHLDEDPFDPCIPDSTSLACLNNLCLEVRASVFLEGPLQSGKIGEYAEEMNTRLNRFGYLPGQRPVTLLGTTTDPGQPYNTKPWFYEGNEGLEFNVFRDGPSELYPSDAVDWIMISIRTRTNVESTVCTKPALVFADGTVIMTEFFDCCNMSEEEYYIVIEHRNHLPVMTPTPMPVVDGVVSFDFRASQTYTRLFGSGQKEIRPGVFVMYAGNGDQVLAPESPKDINSNDVSLWAMDNGRHSGYYFQDYDCSGDVNVHDKAIWLLNNGVFTDVDR